MDTFTDIDLSTLFVHAEGDADVPEEPTGEAGTEGEGEDEEDEAPVADEAA